MKRFCQSISLSVFCGILLAALTCVDALAAPVGQAGGAAAAGAGAVTQTAGSADDTLGGVIGTLIDSTSNMTWLFSAFSYMAGLVFGFLAIIKTKDHVENPNQTPIWDPLKRTLAAGAFFALPTVINAVIATVGGQNGDGYEDGGFNGASTGVGLDAMIVRLMKDIFVPAQNLFGWFGYIAGILLVLVGISRLLKSEQDGPRGPTGIGTIMTFIVAGCLFSMNAMISYFSESLFGTSTLANSGALKYTDGLGGAADHVHAVISAIVAFSIILGWVSMLRGFFILRGVSEGNSQASMMAAITHLIGGALAINLGAIINVVQDTLGITTYGITFS